MFKLFNSLYRKLPKYSEVNWRKEDVIELYKFLGTPTGYKFVQFFNNQIIQKNHEAVNRHSGFDNSCGQAIGYQLAVRDIEILSSLTTETEDAEKTEQ